MSLTHLKKFTGPLLWLLALWLSDNQQVQMLSILLWMLSWWIFEVVPIGVTALLPMVLFPISGIEDMQTVTSHYANPIIYLFFGGFVLGLAIEKWNLHRRIALNIMRKMGSQPQRVILGAMIATALLSTTISNTATTIMMLPIGLSVIQLLDQTFDGAKTRRNFALAMLLGVAYAANIGGMTTLIGTPPNLVLANLAEDAGIQSIGFASWLFFALPLVLVLFLALYFILTRLAFPMPSGRMSGVPEMIRGELQKIGELSTAEKRTAVAVGLTALLWMIRPQLNKIAGLHALSDAMIAITASIAFFIIPAGDAQRQPLLVWKDTKRLSWGILLLFGGGISLANGMEKTEIVNLVGNWIGNRELDNAFLLILVVTAFSIFLTEVMSNVALVSVFIPVSFVIARNTATPDLALAIPLTMGASCAFMFPISTPPNAIVFSSGHIKMKDMIRVGVWLNLLCMLAIAAYGNNFWSYFFE